ncbi:MAG: hypothetical protein LC721_09640, partial [Actinobacteria bacterium]|nr:hypothetical protein [Actinomycetota bacterium]
AGVTQATIWQRLRDERDLRASLASVKRWVAANLPEEVRRDRNLLRPRLHHLLLRAGHCQRS